MGILGKDMSEDEKEEVEEVEQGEEDPPCLCIKVEERMGTKTVLGGSK